MTNNPIDGLDPSARLDKQAEDTSQLLHDLYGELCKVEHLRLAYAQIKTNFRDVAIDTLTLETVEGEGVEKFLRQLSKDLQARTYHPAGPSQAPPAKRPRDGRDSAALRDQVVQAALEILLDPVFAPDLPCDPEPEKAIAWVAGAIDRGLTRAYAVTIEECLDAGRQELLLEKVSQRVGDPEIVGLLKKLLASAPQGHFARGPLAPLLGNIAYEGIDRLLQQTRAVGREGTVAHVKCGRWAAELVILLDPDARYDWMLPAVKKRLREELAELKYSNDSIKTEFVDLARGEKLRLLGYELRRVAASQGKSRVEYKRIEEPGRRERPSARPRRRWDFHPLQFAGRSLSWIRIPVPWHLAADAYREVSSIEVGWRHLPITLYPVFALLFGWRSYMALLSLVLIVVCNWRSIPAAVGQARRHWRGVTVAACALAALVCLFLLVSDLYAHLSREVSAPRMPPGFYHGQYSSSWDTEIEPARYGLYVPPHFQKENGPFPLIVFLHGAGERTKDRIFSVCLPLSIATQFGEHGRYGRFEFVAFFPIDPTGQWRPGTPEVEDTMKVLDYVIQRHRVDPARIYLTGPSAGGSGVWRLAEAYPDKWAAVAPMSSFIAPDVQKVRHIPAWIFHGAKDDMASVERQRTLVKQLQEVKADVRYTELPDKGHAIARELYDFKELYDWLATKRKTY